MRRPAPARASACATTFVLALALVCALAALSAPAPAWAQTAASVPLCLAAAEAANREPTLDVVGEPATLDEARDVLEREWQAFRQRSGANASADADATGLAERQAFAGALYVRLGCPAVTGTLL